MNTGERSAASRLKGCWGTPRETAPTIPINPERYLIVTEGTQTEPNYFSGISDRINNTYHGDFVSVSILGCGMNTISLFKQAKKTAESYPSGFTQVWIVYDKDDFNAANFNYVDEACSNESDNDTAYYAAWSNEAFELWFLLHFEHLHSALHRSDYYSKLSSHLEKIGSGEYTKNRNDMFQLLEPYTDQAIRNAKKLENINQGKTPSDSSPGTNVHKLVGNLLPYIQDRP